jgi:phospholipase/carboxylesterase
MAARFEITEEARRGWRRGELSVSTEPASPRTDAEPGIHWPDGRPGAGPALVVPRRLPERAALVVLLHGAGGMPAGMIPFLQIEAEARGVLLLVPKSGGSTWDVIHGGFGPDVAAIDRELAQVLDRFSVDPARIVIGGFSDGASYALSLGLTNGRLFSRILAFSPGFLVAPTRTGKPAIFVSHGLADPVLPIDRCSRRIVPRLRNEGYDVDFREFPGRHEVPPDMVSAALEPVARRLDPR